MSSIDPNAPPGAEYIRARIETGMSPLGVKVADFFGYALDGAHHLHSKSVQKTEWNNPRIITVTMQDNDQFSTFDSDRLTIMVFLAHELGMKMTIHAAAPHYLRFEFEERPQRSGHTYLMHPTLMDAAEAFEARFPRLSMEAQMVNGSLPENHPWRIGTK